MNLRGILEGIDAARRGSWKRVRAVQIIIASSDMKRFGSSLDSVGKRITIYHNLRSSETAAAHPAASRRGIQGAAA